MDNIDRNLATFLHPPLVAFLAITGDAMGEQKHAFASAAGGLGPGGVSGLRAAQISRDDNFQTQRERRKRSKDGSTGQQIEVWDDADFDNSEVGSTTPRSLAASGGLIPTLDERAGEGSSSAVLDRNMANATVKMRISNTSSVSADAFDGSGGGQDDGSLSGHSFIRHLSKHSMPATPTSTASSSGSKKEFTRTPDDAPERGDKNDVLLRLCALFPFTAQETNEISLATGDVIDVTSSDESGWWLGRVKGVSGYFPQTYCRALTQEEELDHLGKQSSRNLFVVSDCAGAVSRNCPMPRVSSGTSAGSTGRSYHRRLSSLKVRND
jgi:Variant SH3 domain